MPGTSGSRPCMWETWIRFQALVFELTALVATDIWRNELQVDYLSPTVFLVLLLSLPIMYSQK